MSWNMSPRYGHVILVGSYPVLTADNWQFCECSITRCGLAKNRLRHPSLPFDSLSYPTLTIRRRVRTLGQSRENQLKEVDHVLWVWVSFPCALRARGSPATNLNSYPAALSEAKSFHFISIFKNKDSLYSICKSREDLHSHKKSVNSGFIADISLSLLMQWNLH